MEQDRITLTVGEVAGRLGISRGLAYELVARGELPAVRLGRRLVIPARAFDRWLEEAAGVVLDASARTLGAGRAQS